MAKRTYEVLTYVFGDWENTWNEDDKPQLFDTEREAEDAIHEFFADLSRAGMTGNYDLRDYRVERVT